MQEEQQKQLLRLAWVHEDATYWQTQLYLTAGNQKLRD